MTPTEVHVRDLAGGTVTLEFIQQCPDLHAQRSMTAVLHVGEHVNLYLAPVGEEDEMG